MQNVSRVVETSSPYLGPMLCPFHRVTVKGLQERTSAKRTVRAAFGQILGNPPLQAGAAQKIAATTMDGDALEGLDLVVADWARVACLFGTSPGRDGLRKVAGVGSEG